MEPESVLGLLGAEELVVVGGGALVDGRESFRPVSDESSLDSLLLLLVAEVDGMGCPALMRAPRFLLVSWVFFPGYLQLFK